MAVVTQGGSWWHIKETADAMASGVKAFGGSIVLN